MKILVCVKRVPLTGGKIVLTADEQAIETRHLGFTISPHEECGVEEAVRLVEAHGGESVVLTLGPAEAVEQLRDAMAIGIDRGIHLETDGEEWDPEATGGAIAEAIRRGRGRLRPVRPHPPRQRVGRLRRLPDRPARSPALGRPCATGLKGVVVERRRRCAASRRSGGGRDVYVLPLPAVRDRARGPQPPALPVGAGSHARRSRKPVATPTPARPASRLEKVRLVVPEGQSKQAEVLGNGADAAPAVVEMLEQIGVVWWTSC